MSDSVILKTGDFMELLRKGNYVRVSHLELKPVHHWLVFTSARGQKLPLQVLVDSPSMNFSQAVGPYNFFQVQQCCLHKYF